MKREEIKIGDKYGMLTILREVDAEIQFNKGRKTPIRKVECICDCGKKTIVRHSSIKRGATNSCGCLTVKTFIEKNRIINFKHGLQGHRLFHIWSSMRQRCFNKRCHAYKDYGGRGITVCAEWNTDFLAFYDWAILSGYKKELTIDRINNNGNYEPLNCRWATSKQQGANKRNNHRIVYDFNTYILTDACNVANVSFKAFHYKIKYLKLNFEEQVNLWKVQKQKKLFASISGVVRINAKALLGVIQ